MRAVWIAGNPHQDVALEGGPSKTALVFATLSDGKGIEVYRRERNGRLRLHPYPSHDTGIQVRPGAGRDRFIKFFRPAGGRRVPATHSPGITSWFAIARPSKRLVRLQRRGAFIGQAPLAIAIVMESARRPQLDAGRAIQQMELMAWSEGLGTCFVGIRGDEQQQSVKTLLGIPEGMELVTVLPFGYRTEGRRATGTPRKPMAEIAHSETFGTPYAPTE